MNRSKFAFAAAAIACTAVVVVAAVPALQEMGMPKPTEQHKKILMGVGEWEGTVTMFVDPTGKMIPAGEAKPSPAKEVVTPIGEFWTLSQFHSEFMGMPYHGSGYVGYDEQNKKFIGTWCDNTSSYFAMMEGQFDPKTKAIVMRWEAPGLDGKMAAHRSETIEEGDKRTMTFFKDESAGSKTMVIEMKRKGGKAVGAGATK